jgi:outer membrane biosynthesis protein TonB
VCRSRIDRRGQIETLSLITTAADGAVDEIVLRTVRQAGAAPRARAPGRRHVSLHRPVVLTVTIH